MTAKEKINIKMDKIRKTGLNLMHNVKKSERRINKLSNRYKRLQKKLFIVYKQTIKRS